MHRDLGVKFARQNVDQLRTLKRTVQESHVFTALVTLKNDHDLSGVDSGKRRYGEKKASFLQQVKTGGDLHCRLSPVSTCCKKDAFFFILASPADSAGLANVTV